MPDTIPPTSPPLSKSKVFWRRLSSFVLLWTVLLAALFSGNRLVSNCFFLVVVSLLAALGLVEFYGLVQKRGLVCFKNLGVLGGLALMVGTFLHLTGCLGIHDTPARVNDFETIFLILFVLGLCLRQFLARGTANGERRTGNGERGTRGEGLVAVSTTLFGLMYVPWLLNFIQKINFFPFPPGSAPDAGTFYLLYFVLVTKFSDSGAYVVGSLFGRHKMIPRVSPGKTWEGFAGAIVASTLASLLLTHFGKGHFYGMNWRHAIILGVLLSVAAVVGDLIESLFKREAGVKDSGHYFPGIGGILDLLDSLLFNAPLMYLYLRHILTHP